MNNHVFDSSSGRQYTLQDSFRKDMRKLLDSGVGSDVSFIINGVSPGIPAHSSIVAVRCKAIRSEVCKFRSKGRDNDRAETSTMEIPIDSVSLPIFRKVLEYVYTGTIALQAADVYDVCSISAQLGIGSLQSIVFSYLRNEENVRQIVTVLDRALQDSEQNRLLVVRLTEYLAENCSKLLWRAPYEELSVDLMLHIIKQENLGASEYEIWQALVEWGCMQCSVSPPKAVSAMSEREKKRVRECLQRFCRPGYLRILNFDTETFAREVEPLGSFPPAEMLLKYRFDAVAGNAAFEHAYHGDRYSFLLRVRQRTACYESTSHPHPRGVSQTFKVQMPRWATEMKVVFDPRTALGRYSELEFCTDERRAMRVYSVRASEVPGTMCLLSDVETTTPYWAQSRLQNHGERSGVSARALGVEPIYISGNSFWCTFYSPQNVGDSAWGYKFFVSIAR
ncbi:unnamed protein product [Chondrus crispus]|uniref:BTB domain-containing protein n=1 Tax=Chondrus crispus TaxID=2769 RepID=R7QMW8_CHOCR|nr:unnamed protein product [Chondrus crispus]XP_005719019.1 unnamed protein product [Chondrus crispus]CDF33520.1 unnamed protein product [Chondrus crispus]CDF39108.1 unnamed protein product [Chondrus crispus]|eukprot:XP_005713323.1 unnamed protein product [Chondrus crispus]